MKSMKITKPLRFIALFDLHVGKERVREKGRFVTRSAVNEKAVRAVVKFARDFKPDCLILGGDQVNAGPVSHWLKSKPMLSEGFRLDKELRWLDELVLRPFEQILPANGLKVWMDGNHEAWITQMVEEHPGLEGMIDPAHFLNLQKRGWLMQEQGAIYRLGKLYFVHGDAVFRKGGYVNPARRLVEAYHRNIRAGHLHLYNAWTQTTALDKHEYHTGIVVPSLSSRAPAYGKGAPNNWVNGFLYGTVLPGGNFTDHVVVMVNNSFVWNNRLYKGD